MDAVVPSSTELRFPGKIINYYMWLYHRFPLSFHENEEMKLQRGVVVSDDAIRQYRCTTFRQTYANTPRQRRPRPGISGTSELESTPGC